MDPYSLIQQSVAQNNVWSAEQAQKQMDFQREMSNTAFQRQVADLKAAGLNPVLAARLGGASSPSGAMGSTDTSGTSALVELLEMSMETANAAAGAARAATATIEDNSARNLKDIHTTADQFHMSFGDDGKYHFDKTGKGVLSSAQQKINSVLDLVPGGSYAKKWVNAGFKLAEDGLNFINDRYTFNSAKAAELEANRRRLQIENYQSMSYRKGNGGR